MSLQASWQNSPGLESSIDVRHYQAMSNTAQMLHSITTESSWTSPHHPAECTGQLDQHTKYNIHWPARKTGVSRQSFWPVWRMTVVCCIHDRWPGTLCAMFQPITTCVSRLTESVSKNMYGKLMQSGLTSSSGSSRCTSCSSSSGCSSSSS